MKINLIPFDMRIGRQKPETIIHKNNACPFCNVSSLTDIIAREGSIILLKNKYNVVIGADQFVLIENNICESDTPDYTREHHRRIIRIGIEFWRSLQRSGKYRSVLFFKNHGPFSGGTIRHPHSQIIAFPDVDPSLTYFLDEFEGIPIDTRSGVRFNISTTPRMGFGELNICAENDNALDIVADYIQIAVDYLTKYFSKRETSYNIFFYPIEDRLRIKILPRFATPPLFVGYNIRFRPSNINALAEDIKKKYF
ncbi:DUF4931 domain-containing protein [Selenomonas sp. TAMA-11512]|uniref:DUF4931 domain-containing protein n=1 Tax=Selenomonas sp. TAMA-11512 TaxID=3095337 RepID=UPI003090D5A8|nr:DUF4931 domain-containing protein [Selenomonas sp. TAMA-11512]